MISVVIATYNGEKYIRQQLDSILNQTVKADEILICDDVSKDSTMEILKEYERKNANIVVWQNAKNLGYAQNFWNLLNKASNEYIVLSDQDDIWHPNKLEEITKVLDNNANILSLNTGFSFIDSDGNAMKNYKMLKHKNSGNVNKVTFESFVNSPRYLGMAMAIRKELLGLVTDTRIEIIHAHDWCLNHTAAYNDGMYYCENVLTDYRLHENNTYGSSVNSGKDEARKRRLKVINDEIELADILVKCYSNTMYGDFLEKHKSALRQRKSSFESHKICKLLGNYIINKQYLSLRGLLGDLYTLIKTLSMIK